MYFTYEMEDSLVKISFTYGIESKHYTSSRISSVKLSRESLVYTVLTWLDSSIGRAAVRKPEGLSSNPALVNFLVDFSSI